MFRKLTTIIDSKLVKKLEADMLLAQSTGFRECMSLATTMVASASFQLSRLRPPCNVVELQHLPLDNPSDAGIKLCHVMFASQRLEAVVKHLIPGFFLWDLFFYRSGEKNPFFRAQFHVNYEGSFLFGYSTCKV